MPTADQLDALRALPQVEELLHHQAIVALLNVLPRELVVGLVRASVDTARKAILDGCESLADRDEIAFSTLRRALQLEKPSLKRVVNASGVIIHTNLGRSVLADAAVDAVSEVARSYCTLEYDCANMARGNRHDHYERMICALTGAEAAIAVNNNAAAVMVVLAEFSGGREAIISRGELVEIGGSFRVPDIMALSNAHMVEVGTTNKTHLFDYERAVNPETAMLLKVHPSNFRMTGFTESVSVKELRHLADRINKQRETSDLDTSRREKSSLTDQGAKSTAHARRMSADNVLVYEDLGSGAFVEMAIGDFRETTVKDALAEGADIVSFSCDKLLGGPQAGIIVGNAQLIERLKRSPFARVLRLDKMTIAALEATLRLYLDESQARMSIPTVRMLTETADDVLPRTTALRDALAETLSSKDVELSIVPDVSRAGGGALPMCDIATYVVRVAFVRGCAQDCEHHLIAERTVPVIARISNECILLDGRTLIDDDEASEIARAFAEYFASIP